ncbi:hypothetical protein F5146DRAFT_995291 [Armillaria mellea]|nr:hypothetical protein F5146DRAFT_995291 [Armillaria mellea]
MMEGPSVVANQFLKVHGHLPKSHEPPMNLVHDQVTAGERRALYGFIKQFDSTSRSLLPTDEFFTLYYRPYSHGWTGDCSNLILDILEKIKNREAEALTETGWRDYLTQYTYGCKVSDVYKVTKDDSLCVALIESEVYLALAAGHDGKRCGGEGGTCARSKSMVASNRTTAVPWRNALMEDWAPLQTLEIPDSCDEYLVLPILRSRTILETGQRLLATISYAIPTAEIPATPQPKPKKTRTEELLQRDNPYGGKVTFYRIDEVEALAERLREDPSSSQSLNRPSVTRKKKGGSITKTDALAHYSLQLDHLDGIRSRDVKKIPHDESQSMYIYDVVDVEELAKGVHGPGYRLPKRPAEFFMVPDLDEDNLYPGYHKWY